jgi:hypothetical protein
MRRRNGGIECRTFRRFGRRGMSLNTPQSGAQAPSRNAPQVLRNPDFGAVRGVKTHIISGIRHQCCRPARSHTRSRAGKGKPDASLPRRPAFAVCGSPSRSNVEFFNEIFAQIFGYGGCDALQSLRFRANRSVRRRYYFNSHSNAASTFVNTRRSTHRFCATVSRKQCESRCPGLQTDATLHLYRPKTRVLFPNSYLSTREMSAGTSEKSRRSLFLFVQWHFSASKSNCRPTSSVVVAPLNVALR